MDWYIWLGVVAAVLGILSAVDHWLRPVFRPFFLHLFKRDRKPPESASTIDKRPLPQKLINGEKSLISLHIPMPNADFKHIEVTVTVEYVDGLPEAELPIREIFNQARALKHSGKYVQATEFFQKCLKSARFPEQKFALYNEIGNCYLFLFRYNQARANYNKAIKLANKVNDQEGLGTALLNCGVVYMRQNKLNEALTYFENALRISREGNDKFREARTLNNLGTIYKNKGELDKALHSYETALEITKSIGDKEVEGCSLVNIGSIYYRRLFDDTSDQKEELEKPIEYYEQALNIFREIGNAEYEAIALAKKVLYILSKVNIKKRWISIIQH